MQWSLLIPLLRNKLCHTHKRNHFQKDHRKENHTNGAMVAERDEHEPRRNFKICKRKPRMPTNEHTPKHPYEPRKCSRPS